MKARMTIPGTKLGARLTTLCWGALTLLAPVAVSACSGGSSSSPTVPTFSPSVTISPTVTRTASSGSTTAPSTPGVTSSAPATHTATATATATATVTVTPTATYSTEIPTVAPVTGGGGTAGLQDVTLFGLGAAAILVGAGSIAYRRWLTRNR